MTSINPQYFSNFFDEAFWLYKSNYGRLTNWEILYGSTVIGSMKYIKKTDMFWDLYEVSWGIEFDELVKEWDHWEQCEFIFKKPEIDMICENAFAGGNKESFIEEFHDKRTNQISMRALYFIPSSNAVSNCIGFLKFVMPARIFFRDLLKR